MKLENQQVNLELSQQLKEAGYKQEGLWWWVKLQDGWAYGLTHWTSKNIELREGGDKFVAPTVAELGERLPVSFKKVIQGIERKAILKFNKYSNSMYQVLYDFQHPDCWEKNIATVKDTEANARAKMWLYLKKEGLL